MEPWSDGGGALCRDENEFLNYYIFFNNFDFNILLYLIF
jgi:hypothetical protein